MSATADARAGSGIDADALHDAWRTPPGVLGWLQAVNHKNVGLRFIATSLIFFLAGGVLALLIRAQLAFPESDVLGAEAYNEAFTLHGTTMMFLFAVPMVEGLGMYLLPLMLGTRDLPFPRLNAFGYWTFVAGGLFLYSGLLVGQVPDGGWFAYVPLTGPEFSPERGMDFWLLGVTLAEISALIGAIELIVCFLRRRAPGMALHRVPIFAWSIFVMAWMILLAFPALITASILLEVERVFATGFYDVAAGGDPLLWQHLFWIFGHPEVYIMFLPAAGVVSTVIPTFSRRPLAGYTWVVAATVAIGILSFGLWIHHMFAVGLDIVALGIFSAASMLIALPNGVQFFAWLATLWGGRPQLRVPLLYCLGFLFIFLIGGITGVMVAAAPFDWQVHDTFFVVAHFHYVLVGGVVFPVIAGLYYWFPKWTGRMPGGGLGIASFWLLLAGFNVAFFPQHLLGFDGMPRRIFTYPADEGWGAYNLISSLGAVIIALGVLCIIADLAWAWRRGRPAGDDPWRAPTLEWATASPPPTYGFGRIPVVAGGSPLWDDEERRAGRDEAALLAADDVARPPGAVREVLETTATDARVQAIVRLPGPTLWPLGASAGLVVVLVGALLYEPWVVAAGGALTVVMLLAWAQSTARQAEVTVGVEGRPVPVRSSGAGRLGIALGLVAVAMIGLSVVFAYALIWSGADAWPAGGASAPAIGPGVATVALAVVGAACVTAGRAALAPATRVLAAAALASGGILLGLSALAGWAWLDGMGIDAVGDAYASVVVAAVGFAMAVALAALPVAGFASVRALAGGGRPAGPAPAAVATAVALFAAAAWAVMAALVLLAPRVGG